MVAINSLYLIQIETTVKAEPNVRIRIRGAIIRVQITETRIRTIIRISRQEATPNYRHLKYFVLIFPIQTAHVSPFFRCSVTRHFAVRQKRHKRKPPVAPESEER